jgi:two-component system, OmpR family, response regulator
MPEKPTHILIVDDDHEIRELLAKFLGQYGYRVSVAENGQAMREVMAQSDKIDLLILDIMMPGDDGITLCKELRLKSNVPVIMLSAMAEESDRIVGLEIGADDYISKPFNPRELVARVKAVLRRFSDHQKSISSHNALRFDGWVLKLHTRSLVSPDRVESALSAGEFDMLLAFLENAQKILSRDQLLDFTKNRAAGPFDRSIDMQVSRLRQKIEKDPKSPIYIKTIRGGGYLFSVEVKKTQWT